MKKLLLLALLCISWSAYSATLDITVIAAPVDSAITMDAYVWDIDWANDGITPYQNDHQGTMTIKSGSRFLYTVTFSSQNAGYLKKGSAQIAYSIKATQITSGWVGVWGNPSILSQYVQLTSPQSIMFIWRTPKNGIQFYAGVRIPATGEFYEDGIYTDTLTISFAAM